MSWGADNRNWVWTGTLWVPMLGAADGSIIVGGAAGSVAAADNMANPTAGQGLSYGFVYDGTTWDRWRGTSVAGAGNVTEQLAPSAEDNSNGVYAVVEKPLAASTYCASVSTNQGAANATNVKASAGNLFSITAINTNALARYVFFVNTAGTPVAGSASLIMPMLVPSGSQVTLGEDFFGQTGIQFSTGIGLAMMTTLAGGTLGTAGECYWTARFK